MDSGLFGRPSQRNVVPDWRKRHRCPELHDGSPFDRCSAYRPGIGPSTVPPSSPTGCVAARRQTYGRGLAASVEVIMGTVAQYIRRNAASDHLALLFEDQRYSHRQVVQAAAARGTLLLDERPADPFHVGVLLDNVPEAIFWLQAAALVGATVVGINSTRRGAELARDITHADCGLIVTDTAGVELLDGLDLGMPRWVVETPEYAELLAPYAGRASARRRDSR